MLWRDQNFVNNQLPEARQHHVAKTFKGTSADVNQGCHKTFDSGSFNGCISRVVS